MRINRIHRIRYILNSSRFSRMPCRRHWIMLIIHMFQRIIIKRYLLVFKLYTRYRNFEISNSIKGVKKPYQGTYYCKYCAKVRTQYKSYTPYKACHTCCKEPVVSLRLNIFLKLILGNFMLLQKLFFTHRNRLNKARELVKTNSYNNIDGKKIINITSPSDTNKERKNKSKQTDKEVLLKNRSCRVYCHYLIPFVSTIPNKKGEWK